VESIHISERCDEDGCNSQLNVKYRYSAEGVFYQNDQISLVDWEDSHDSSFNGIMKYVKLSIRILN
jgi:hypothetical protein